ncbi:hypothetical protein [Polyangium aurulentum]|uniref:hypothetical protein n=1 Tax=Polyangium aurulentum TaxID=2567896 RepID=UPI0010AECA4A|nr:hypothetical protein [Polyangium aurulentum]UQA58168.1 hypothetical protein E8A73_044105 [Polyangium aurulentum]
MAKKAKQVDNRLLSSGKVIRAATTHTPTIATALAARAVEIQGPNTKATKEAFAIVLGFLAESLAHGADRLDQAELAVVAERADDIPVREQRDSLHADLLSRLVRIRSNVADAVGHDALRTYGLEGATPRTPREATSHAFNVANLLKQKPFKVEVDGATFDSAGMVATLESKAGALHAALEDIEREDQELADALGRRDRITGTWTDDYQGVADALTGLFRLGGRKDLAERVRPTSRTLSGEEVLAGEEEPLPTEETPSPQV